MELEIVEENAFKMSQKSLDDNNIKDEPVPYDNEDSLVSIILMDENDDEISIKKEKSSPEIIEGEKFTYEDDNSFTITEEENNDTDENSLLIEYTNSQNEGVGNNFIEEIIVIKKPKVARKHPNHICSYCQKNFKSEKVMNSHIDIVHLGKLPFICEICGISCKSMSLLRDHILLHTNERPFACDVCHKTFKSKMRLNIHKDIHADTKYVCPDCGRLLNSKRTFNVHRKSHTDHKKFKCEYCGSAFAAMKNLKNHIIMHTGIKPYECNFCDRRFAYGSSLRSHKKEAHALKLAECEKNGEKHDIKPNIPSLEKLLAFSRAAARGEVKAVKSQKRVFYRYNQNYKKNDNI